MLDKPQLLLGLTLLLGCLGCSDGKAKKPERRPAPVATATVERGEFVVKATFTGDIVAEIADIAAESQGRLESVPARIGQHVQDGDLLASIDSQQLRLQLAAAVARAAAAAAEREPARRELERSKPLVEQGLLSAQAIDELRARVAAIAGQAEAAEAEAALLRQRVADCEIRSPMAGVVSTRLQSPGSWVSVGTPLFRIVATDQVYAKLRIPETDIARLQVGSPVELEVTGVPEPRRGKISGIAGEILPGDRSAWAEVKVSDATNLSHGMFARGHIELARLSNVIIVPTAAVIERLRDNKIVKGIFTATDSTARWVTAETLASDEKHMAVAANLQAGDIVLVRGHLSLNDGAAIEVVGGAANAATAAARQDR